MPPKSVAAINLGRDSSHFQSIQISEIKTFNIIDNTISDFCTNLQLNLVNDVAQVNPLATKRNSAAAAGNNVFLSTQPRINFIRQNASLSNFYKKQIVRSTSEINNLTASKIGRSMCVSN